MGAMSAGGGEGCVATPLLSDDDPEWKRKETAQQTKHQSVEPGLTGGPSPYGKSQRRLGDVKLQKTTTSWEESFTASSRKDPGT